MSLRDQLQSDLDAILADDGFEEDVSYTAKGEDPVECTAVIYRGPLAAQAFDRAQRLEYKLAAWLSRTVVTNLKLNVDTLTCKEKEQDAAAQTFTIRALLHEDPAGLLVALS